MLEGSGVVRMGKNFETGLTGLPQNLIQYKGFGRRLFGRTLGSKSFQDQTISPWEMLRTSKGSRLLDWHPPWIHHI
jgi:hypothetical protein